MKVVRNQNTVKIELTFEDLTADSTQEQIQIPKIIPPSHVVESVFCEIVERFDGDTPQLSINDVNDEFPLMLNKPIDAETNFYTPAPLDDTNQVSTYELDSDRFSRTDAIAILTTWNVSSGSVATLTQGILNLYVNVKRITQ